MHRGIAPILVLLACHASSAIAQTKDHAPTGLPYASSLRQDRGESWTYRHPNLDLRKYRQFIIDPSVVYQGPDAQFDDVDRGDRARYAEIMTEALRAEIGRSFPIATRSGENIARIRLTLLGVDETKGGVATATRVTPVGFALSAVKSLADKPGTLTGSVLFAIELTDSRSGELQIAAVRRESPDALDIPATTSTTNTVKAVAETVAKQVREKLESAAGR